MHGCRAALPWQAAAVHIQTLMALIEYVYYYSLFDLHLTIPQ